MRSAFIGASSPQHVYLHKYLTIQQELQHRCTIELCISRRFVWDLGDCALPSVAHHWGQAASSILKQDCMAYYGLH